VGYVWMNWFYTWLFFFCCVEGGLVLVVVMFVFSLANCLFGGVFYSLVGMCVGGMPFYVFAGLRGDCLYCC